MEVVVLIVMHRSSLLLSGIHDERRASFAALRFAVRKHRLTSNDDVPVNPYETLIPESINMCETVDFGRFTAFAHEQS